MGVDVPRIEPIPLEEMTPEVRSIIEEGVAAGTYATPVPLQIFAYKTSQIMMVNMARQAFGKNALLGGRITELLRIRSAQLGECQPCSQSRKHDSISDEDVACLIAPGHGGDLTEQERLAVEFLDLLSADHHAIDDETYRQARRGLHVGADRGAGFRLCQRHGPAPLPAHAGPVRHGRPCHPLQRRPGRRGQAGPAGRQATA